MKIYFVGIHNKPGMKPLDSKTKSGKIIDQIISQFPDCECIKTNLCDIDYFPIDRFEIREECQKWNETYGAKEDSIIVLLGA